ncbi:tetratricopeptide repeat protein [Cognatiyoonia sp. IB215446]|uniref:tetratricopeptide repeat protein n=1 Tax=Cognatiyoonia sp. IB215446 TaxID=3097355 RepID=UPI002A0E02BB|nr:tetratricopeptide repeat protein [Cognatiyoonia sp. IB215446]MDX8349395.1 tetratricopeptide repeat protein [Cognatiyoonia sp. IB215446]
MLTDTCTCETSLNDQAAIAAWNGVIHGVLSHGQATGDHLTRLITLAPDFAMGHAMKGLACLMLGRRELVAAAAGANEEAKRALALGGATEREKLWCMALEDWLQGSPTRAVSRMEAALDLNPADTISMKLSHGIRFMLGDNHGMLQSIERVIPAHGPDHPLYGYALGCHAFALEERGYYARAEHVGLHGLEFAADDAWGLHAVAHVYDMTHLTAQGIAIIDDNADAWNHCNNFRFHVWWHKALLHLDQGDIETVLHLYDTKVRDEKTDDYRDFSNASSLLMRLELEGIDIGDRWIELAELAETRADDGCLTFADMHYMLALIGDDRPDATARMNANVAKHAAGDDDMAAVMTSPGIATSEGLTAFGAADYQRAFAHLKAAQPHFQKMGGSHAQRDVFERLTIEAGLRAGRLTETGALLQARTKQRDGHEDAFAALRMAEISKLQSLSVSSTAAE